MTSHLTDPMTQAASAVPLPTALRYLAVPAADARRVRADRRDGFGNDLVPFTAEPGLPLRCCLSLSVDGEQVALIAYRPSGSGGPYAEVGPIFIHADDGCAADPAVFPQQFRERLAVLRPYDEAGRMLDGVLAAPGQSERLLAVLFADPAVDSVQVRNVVAGCWNFTVRRAPASAPDAAAAAAAAVAPAAAPACVVDTHHG